MSNMLAPWRKYMPFSAQRNKVNPFQAVQTAFDRMLEDFYTDFKGTSGFANEMEGLMITPSIDITESKDFFKIEVEVPGIGPESLKVTTESHAVTIKGEKTVSHKDKDRNYAVREIAYGAYQRTIPLPESVDIEKAKASFKDGILTIEVPKKASAMEHYKELAIESA
ncbi:MAG: HSP20 family protein [Glomeribacter sp. 1016415]|nr:HSP20 family protein [Glomeribacter sp. 1016415]